MRKITCWWAGMLISEHEVRGWREEESLLDSLKKQLDRGEITWEGYGMIFILTELCIDVVENGIRAELRSIKKQ